MHNPKFQFLVENNMFLPKKSGPLETGYDVFANGDYKLYPGIYTKIDLGFKVFSPPGWWLRLYPRSSTFMNLHLHCLYGIIDESYEGNVILGCVFMPDSHVDKSTCDIKNGQKIAQLVPEKRVEMTVSYVSREEWDSLISSRNAERGAGGFGSTGK